jgi:hypothetical protein
MPSVRHLIVEGSSSSVDNGGAGTVSYHTLYLPHATQETVQQCFATDGAGLPEMIARQAAVIATLQDGPNILFVQGGQNDLVATDPFTWLSELSRRIPGCDRIFAETRETGHLDAQSAQRGSIQRPQRRRGSSVAPLPERRKVRFPRRLGD